VTEAPKKSAAYVLGEEAHADGHPADYCPFPASHKERAAERADWISAWYASEAKRIRAQRERAG